MKVNKLFLSALLILTFSGASAFAKTEGSYAGFDLLKSKSKFKEIYSYSNVSQEVSGSGEGSKNSNSNFGLGLNYKYAFNFKGAFIAPGVVYEHHNNNNKGDNGVNLKIKDRYALKADVGYDVTDKIAPYLTTGYSVISYSAKNYFDNGDGAVTASLKNNHGDWFYGAGLKYDYSEKLSFSLEYNTQSFAAKTKVPDNDYNYKGVYKTKFEVFKAGLAYRF